MVHIPLYLHWRQAISVINEPPSEDEEDKAQEEVQVANEPHGQEPP